MNNQRRKEIAAATAFIEQADALLQEAAQILEQAQWEEQDYYDNMPESLQGGEKGDRAMEAADQLQAAVDALSCFDADEIYSAIQTAVEG